MPCVGLWSVIEVFLDHNKIQGAQWLSGIVLDSRPKGPGFEPHRHHCIVSLSMIHISELSTGSTQGLVPT